jgi:hypothetical protein
MKTWRVGRKLGRTLYCDDVCVGMVDTPELAAEIVAAMNKDQLAVTSARAVDRMAVLDLLKKCGITPAGTMTNEEDLLAVGRYIDALLKTADNLIAGRFKIQGKT